MSLFQNAINCIAIFIILIIATFYLRAKGVLRPTNNLTLSRLITELVLPAYLFHQLASAHLSISALKAAGGLITAEIILAFLAYPFGKYCLNLSNSALSVFILCSTFSSTGLLGNSFLKLIYETNPDAIAEGIIVGQLAITTPNYLITPAILSKNYSPNKTTTLYSQIFISLLSPPNIAIVCGLMWAIIGIRTTGYIFDPLFDSMKIIGDTIPLLTAMSIGLSLNEFPRRKDIYAIVICSVSILILEPILIHFIDKAINEPFLDRQVSLLLAAMPAAQVIAVYAIKYEASPEFACTLITATTVLSAITIPLLIYVFNITGM